MAREKLTPEQTGQQEYDRDRRWQASHTDRQLVTDAHRRRNEVDQREFRNTFAPAPFAEAKERAKLRASLDEVRSRRYATDTTLAALATSAPPPVEPVYPYLFIDSSNA